MNAWKDRLNADPTTWLLGSKDPSLRYRVLTELLDRPAADSEVSEAKLAVMEGGPVAGILSEQGPEGHWGRREDFYMRSKYKGTVWNLIQLAELGADPDDTRIRMAGDFVLRWSRKNEGGFSHRGTINGGSAESLPCLTGNMLYALGRLGFKDDVRLTASIDLLLRMANDGRMGSIYEKCERCRSGVVKALKGLSEMPEGRSDRAVKDAKVKFAKDIVERCLPPKAHDGKVRPEWRKFGFPLMWNTDLIEMLDLVGREGLRDERMEIGLEMVVCKQDNMGRWPMERNFNGRHLVRFEQLGKPSRWTTFRALAMLKHLPR